MDIAQEIALVEKAKESLESFDKLYEFYLPRIYGFIFNRTGNHEISEDVTSQTFIKAMLNIKKFRYKGFTFGSWLYRIAHNNLMDYYRKNPSLTQLETNMEESDEKTENEAEFVERKRLIRGILRQLPGDYQEILSLKYFEELSNEEMADILGYKKGTLAVKLHRSLKAFKKALEKSKLQAALQVNL
jgi:RNA polymerase sigma factor (sigma-70 family)